MAQEFIKKMLTKDSLNGVKVKQIRLSTRLQDIPGDVPCLLCGHETRKAYLSYRLGTNIIFSSNKTAGYRCANGCDIEFLSHEAVIEALEIVKREYTILGKTTDARIFEEAKEFELAFLHNH